MNFHNCEPEFHKLNSGPVWPRVISYMKFRSQWPRIRSYLKVVGQIKNVKIRVWIKELYHKMFRHEL
jgi:hypothetical protein